MKAWCLFFLFYLCHFSVLGKDIPIPLSQYNYNYLTEDIGLPHNFVDDIFKDSQGYVWIATYNGLARYDGYSFLTFTSSTAPIQLKSNFIYKVCEDNFRRLWVASEEGIDIIDLDQYCTVDLKLKEDSPLWKPMHSYVSSLYKDSRGNIWISSGKTLYCIELDKTGKINNYYYLEKGVSTIAINAVVDLGWAVCAGIDNAVMRIEKRGNHLLKAEYVSQLLNAFSGDWRIFCMDFDGEYLWIGTNRGLFRYNHFEQQIKRYRHSSSQPGMLSQSYVTDVKSDKKGNLYVATLKGLNVYNRKEDTFFYILHDNSHRTESLNCNFINCLLPDADIIWVGTEIGGINLLIPRRLSVSVWRHEYTDASSLSPNPVNAICEDKDGNLWVGTVEGGLNLKRKGRNDFEHFLSNQKDSTSLSHNSVCGLLLDTDNQLWAYTWGLGMNKLDLNNTGIRKFKQYYYENGTGVTGNFVASACEDVVNQGVWFGTTEGLHFYDKQQKRFIGVKFPLSSNKFDSMGALLVDKKNRLWVGTSEGLFIIDLFSFARSRLHFNYVYIKHKLSDANSQIPDKINSICQDGKGRIWLGSNGNGLYELTGENGAHFYFKNYTVKDGLTNNNIIGIVEDNNNCLWLSTNRGISKLDMQKKTFMNYTKHDGLLTNQFYWNAYYFSKRENKVYFGNTEGLIAIDPEIPVYEVRRGKVSLTGFSVFGNPVYPSSGNYLKSDISCAKIVSLHERDRSFSIDFSTKDYVNNNLIRYAYRLKGYDENWIETGVGEHTARYTSIPSGNYIFQVRATNAQGHWMDEFAEIAVHVTPYFYKSWWFFCLVAVVLAVGIQRFYRWKISTYRKQKEILEETVLERTSELAMQNDKLVEMSRKLAGTTEERISFFTNITHEFRTPVTLIQGPLKRAIKYSQDPKVTEQLQIAERSSDYLLNLVNELMDFRKLDVDKVSLKKESADFKEFMEHTLIPFNAFARDRNITLRKIYRLDACYLVFDYAYLQKVIVNLVSNAIKFTPNDETITVYVATVSGTDGRKLLYMNVCDGGSGIAEEDLELIFDRFFQSKKSVKYSAPGQSSTGIGLFLCEKIVCLHGGEIQASNNKGKGASIRMLLPYIIGESAETSLGETCVVKEKTDIKEVPSGEEIILVVDDNMDMRAYIRSLLCHTYHVLEAQDGEEALDIILSKPVDLILSDLMMPVMDGMELSRRVKENLSVSHIPFLMLTAIVSEEQKKRSYEIGVDEYLCKPFDEEVLLLRIRNIFALRKKYKSMFAVRMDYESLNINEESRDKKFMMAAIHLMKEHYNDSEYDVNLFVSDLGYSKTLVNSKLQSLTGQSIGQFMRNYRLTVAKEMLLKYTAGGDMNVTEVAYAVGFSDPKYFTKCFKDFFGVLPSSFNTMK